MHPCKFICACYVLLLVFATMTASLGYMMPSLEGTRGRDFQIWDHPYVVDNDKLILAQEYLEETRGDPVIGLQTEYSNGVFVMYENTGDHKMGLLNVEAIKKMKELEDEI